MLTKIRTQKGFTLIELLIVVAIIGILAAIAIPQFSAYRQKAFNSAAVSDVKNVKSAEESLFADNQTYGSTQPTVTLDALGAPTVAGKLINGPMSSAPNTAAGTPGAAIAGVKSDGTTVVGAGVGVSNGVNLDANIDAIGGASAAYVVFAKHTQGTRVYAAESASTAVMFVQDDTWAGTAMTAAGAPAAGIPAAATTNQSITSATAGGGSPNKNWAAM